MLIAVQRITVAISCDCCTALHSQVGIEKCLCVGLDTSCHHMVMTIFIDTANWLVCKRLTAMTQAETSLV